MKTYENLHILLLKGGDGSERKVSLNTAIECAKAIKQIGCKITEVDIAEYNISSLSKINADICFNALHGDYGEDGSIQGFLNLLKINVHTSNSPDSNPVRIASAIFAASL